MEKFRLIPLLTAAVMGCTALLAGCGKGSDSSSKAEEGAKTNGRDDKRYESKRL